MVEGLHARANPPVYYIAEIDVANADAHRKGYVPKVQATSQAAGDRFLAAGAKVTAIEGAPPKSRVVVQLWDSMEKIQVGRNSKEYKEARKIGPKCAKFRAYTVEGLPQK